MDRVLSSPRPELRIGPSGQFERSIAWLMAGCLKFSQMRRSSLQSMVPQAERRF